MPYIGSGVRTQYARLPMTSDNATALYARIQQDQALTQELFRQALQDPHGALGRIVAIGESVGLPVTAEEVKSHLAAHDDGASKQWLVKARGGL